jgi:hypothetical protein
MANQILQNRYIKLSELLELLRRLFVNKFAIEVSLRILSLLSTLLQNILKLSDLLPRKETITTSLSFHEN